MMVKVHENHGKTLIILTIRSVSEWWYEVHGNDGKTFMRMIVRHVSK